MRIWVKFRLTLVSIRGTHCAHSFFIGYNDEFSVPGARTIAFLIARTGHNGEVPRAGIFNILVVSLVCIVLLHLISRWVPGLAKNMSPPAICLIAENNFIE